MCIGCGSCGVDGAWEAKVNCIQGGYSRVTISGSASSWRHLARLYIWMCQSRRTKRFLKRRQNCCQREPHGAFVIKENATRRPRCRCGGKQCAISYCRTVSTQVCGEGVLCCLSKAQTRPARISEPELYIGQHAAGQPSWRTLLQRCTLLQRLRHEVGQVLFPCQPH